MTPARRSGRVTRRLVALLGEGERRTRVQTRIRDVLLRPVRSLFFADLLIETRNFDDVRWLGEPVWQNVLDLWTLQEAIAEIRPALIIETGTNRGGSALYYASLLELLGGGRVVTVDVERRHDLSHPRIEFLLGDSVEAAVVARMTEAARGAGGPVLVVLDSDHDEGHVRAELAAYAPLVTVGSLLLVQDGVIDTHPLFRHVRPGPLPAIRAFLAEHGDSFAVERRWDRRFLVTHHPAGWLRRTAP